VAQVKATVDDLRSALETVRGDADRARATLERRFRDEREQLQRTVAELRSRLETTDGH